MLEHDNRGLELNAKQGDAEFDRLLRSSLETYADAGPDSGIAERVLARIGAEGEGGRTRRMIGWEIALPIAACLIVAIVMLASKSLHQSADNTNHARLTLPASTDAGRRVNRGANTDSRPPVPTRRGSVSRSPRYLAHASATPTETDLPKLDVFPAPQPLTAEEKALVAYVSQVPEAERKSLAAKETKADAPLTIEALEIKPLAPPELQGN